VLLGRRLHGDAGNLEENKIMEIFSTFIGFFAGFIIGRYLNEIRQLITTIKKKEKIR
jgi:hypothetical protein